MKAVILLLALVASAYALTENQYQQEFVKFAAAYGKQYSTDNMFKRCENLNAQLRFWLRQCAYADTIFKDNLDFINAENAKNMTYSLGVNEFSDMSHEEFLSTMVGGFLPFVGEEMHIMSFDQATIPNDADWRGKAVTPVKNQGSCGSCWAFGTTGGIEGAWAIAKGQLISLSEQQLVDCAGSSGNQGCNGGLPSLAYEWIQKNGGLCASVLSRDRLAPLILLGLCRLTTRTLAVMARARRPAPPRPRSQATPMSARRTRRTPMPSPSSRSRSASMPALVASSPTSRVSSPARAAPGVCDFELTRWLTTG